MRVPTVAQIDNPARAPLGRWTAPAAIAGALWVVGFVVASLVVSSHFGRLLLGDGVYHMPGVAAAGLLWWAAMHVPSRRSFWVAMAVSYTLFALGDMAYTFQEVVLHQYPVPSAADVLYVLSLAAVLPAVVLGFGAPLHRWRELLDVGILLLALGYAGIAFVIEPQLAGGITRYDLVPTLETALALVGALALASAVHTAQRISGSLVLISISVWCATAGWMVYAYLVAVQAYTPGSWILTAWQAAGVLAVAAAVVAVREPSEETAGWQPRDVNVLAAAAGFLITLTVMVIQAHQGTLDAEGPATGVISVFAIIARLHLTLRERGELSRRLAGALGEQKRLAATDPLTGLGNRRLLDGQLGLAARKALSGGPPIALLVIDLDHFKTVNDGYGHSVGDEVLREAGARVGAAVRPGDTVARLGGEEFVVLAPGVNGDKLGLVAERCRAAISDRPFAVGEALISVTASVGGASLPEHARHADELVTAADHAMYQAKQSGRNGTHVGPASAPQRKIPLDTAVVAYLQRLADRLDGEQAAQEHSLAMVDVAARLAEMVGLTVDQRRRCLAAARLHDVGKVGVPPAILTKPGALTAAEWEIMREHVRVGADLLAACDQTRDIAPIVGDHHEWYDGSGYPHGKRGDQIALEARVISVADAWTAMLADRPYRRALSEDAARQQLLGGCGSQFDPQIVSAFLRLLERDDPADRQRPAA